MNLRDREAFEEWLNSDESNPPQDVMDEALLNPSKESLFKAVEWGLVRSAEWGITRGLDVAIGVAEGYHHNSADGVEWDDADETMRCAIYSNGTVQRIAAAIEAKKGELEG